MALGGSDRPGSIRKSPPWRAALVASLLAATSTQAPLARQGRACSPSATILESPRAHSLEVQAKAINDRGDVVGFADSNDGKGAIHAILWKGGTVGRRRRSRGAARATSPRRRTA